MSKEVVTRKVQTAKKKVAAKLKTVLLQPFPRYWPEISDEDTKELQKLFKITKEQIGNKFVAKNIGIIYGLSKNVKAIKHESTSCILISTEIQPKFIINQIINLIISSQSKISVLCVPKLKSLTHGILDVQSLAIGFTDTCEAQDIIVWIKQTCEKFPIPVKLIEYYSKSTESLKTPSIGKGQQISPECSKIKKIDLKNIYLKRSDIKCQRAFIPENGKHFRPVIDLNQQKIWGDFISLSGNKKNIDDCRMEVDEDIDEDNFQQEKTRLKKIIKKHINKTKEDQKTQNLDIDMSAEILEKYSKVSIENRVSAVIDPDLYSLSTKVNKEKKNKRKKKGKKLFFSTSPQTGIYNYLSLSVNKIQGNPERNKTKKKK